MADCADCGRPIKPDDWTCGSCGAPLRTSGAGGGAAAPPDPYGYAPGFEPQPPATPVATPVASSGRVRLVATLAVVAILIVVAVWFFALRGPSTTGTEFLGTWTATGAGVGTVTIAQSGGDFSVTMTSDQAGQTKTGTVPAHLDGRDLVITVDDFADASGGQNADAVKAMLTAVAGDFRLVFASVDPTHLSLSIEGTKAAEGADTSATLEKAVL